LNQPARATDEQLLARLHLRAVLPALAELVECDGRARAIVEGWRLRLQIGVLGGLSTTLTFENGRVAVDAGAGDLPRARLLFVSNRHLNNTFRRNGFAWPIVARGLRRYRELLHFRRLTDRLEEILRSSPGVQGEDAGQRRKATLVLLRSVMPAAMTELLNHDAGSRRELAPFGQALALFRVGGQDASWIRWCDGAASAGRGPPPGAPDVIVSFASPGVVLALLGGALDNLAAIGRGDLVVSGLIPVAERLDAVAARAAQLLL
jgi:hypothetical protein